MLIKKFKVYYRAECKLDYTIYKNLCKLKTKGKHQSLIAYYHDMNGIVCRHSTEYCF